MKANGRRTLLVAAIAMMITACMRPPVVELTGVRLAGLGLGGATLIAEFSIDNPNRFAIETDSITFVLDANHPSGDSDTWTRVTKGTNSEQFRIEKQDKASVEIPIELPYAGLSTPVRSILDKGTFNYRVNGQVFIGEPLSKTVPFSQNGNLSMGAGS